MLTEKMPFLPEDGSLAYENVDITNTTDTFPDGYATYTDTWGHTNTTLFSKLCASLGDAGLQVRFRAKTSLHDRQIHFKTREETDDGWMNQVSEGVLNEFKTGSQTSTFTRSQNADPLIDLYDDHTPGAVPSTTNEAIHWGFMGASTNQTTMTDGIFRNNGNNRYWRINEGNTMFF